jgi:hypothetical protein
MPKCNKCGLKFGLRKARRYLLSLSHDDGLEEGQHIGDVELRLCKGCADLVADELVDFKERMRELQKEATT